MAAILMGFALMAIAFGYGLWNLSNFSFDDGAFKRHIKAMILMSVGYIFLVIGGLVIIF
jgi:hypothetical protein